MKNNNKNFELIENLSNLMDKLEISVLDYEIKELKLKIQKSHNSQTVSFNKDVQKNVEKLDNNNQIHSKTKPEHEIEYTAEHPGAIKSPMVGTAYCSPEPGKRAFIKLGENVKKGQPLVIIEAMKVMNTINSDRNGKVVFIGFEDSQPVEFDQLLVIIE